MQVKESRMIPERKEEKVSFRSRVEKALEVLGVKSYRIRITDSLYSDGSHEFIAFIYPKKPGVHYARKQGRVVDSYCSLMPSMGDVVGAFFQELKVRYNSLNQVKLDFTPEQLKQACLEFNRKK